MSILFDKNFGHYHLDGLVLERCNSIASALEIHLSCTNPSICERWKMGRVLIDEFFYVCKHALVKQNGQAQPWYISVWWYRPKICPFLSMNTSKKNVSAFTHMGDIFRTWFVWDKCGHSMCCTCHCNSLLNVLLPISFLNGISWNCSVTKHKNVFKWYYKVCSEVNLHWIV